MKDLVQNRRAFHDYEILETFEAGISLQGTEIKSLRQGGGNLAEAYVKIFKDEVWLIGAHIAPYEYGNIHNHEPDRDRKLLLHRYEIEKLQKFVKEKGYTIVALSLYLKNGKVKVKIGPAKGKKAPRQTTVSDRKRKEKRNGSGNQKSALESIKDFNLTGISLPI